MNNNLKILQINLIQWFLYSRCILVVRLKFYEYIFTLALSRKSLDTKFK